MIIETALLNKFGAGIMGVLDPIVILLILLSGFFVKRYLDGWKLDTALKTLIVGTVFTSFYVLALAASGKLQQQAYAGFFVSYCVATSLYEIILKRLVKSWSRKDNSVSL